MRVATACKSWARLACSMRPHTPASAIAPTIVLAPLMRCEALAIRAAWCAGHGLLEHRTILVIDAPEVHQDIMKHRCTDLCVTERAKFFRIFESVN